MIDEKGMVAALKDAYKSGYRVAFAEGRVMLRCGVWAVEMDEEYLMPTEIYFKGFAERAVICGATSKNSPEMARIEGFPWLGEG